MAEKWILIRGIKSGEMHVLSPSQYKAGILQYRLQGDLTFQASDYEIVMEGTMKEISDYLNPEDTQD